MESISYQIPQGKFKYLSVLLLLHLTIMLTSTSLAYKPVEIFGVTATASSLLFAITFAINSIVAEVYGREESKKSINLLMGCGLVFSILVTLVPHLPSPSDWHHQAEFNYVFGGSFKFALLGTIGSYISYRINIALISRWKILTKGKYFPLRIIGANTFGEFFLVAIVTFGAFYGSYPFNEVVSMFLFAYLSKILYALILSWPAAFAAAIIIKKEKTYNDDKKIQ
jgi:uncharacterized integral membrane protein (TIGR00697 family)